MYAAYLPVIQVLLPRIALPFPTYNATSCYAGSFLVGPKVLCFDAQIQLHGQCEAVSSAYLIVLRTPPPPPTRPMVVKLLIVFMDLSHLIIYFFCWVLSLKGNIIMNFWREAWQKRENKKMLRGVTDSLVRSHPCSIYFKLLTGTFWSSWLDTLVLQTRLKEIPLPRCCNNSLY